MLQACAGSLVKDALSGFSSTVLCYGQTGVGCLRATLPLQVCHISRHHPYLIFRTRSSDKSQKATNLLGLRRSKWATGKWTIAGSGKTYTLLGAPGSFEQRGLAARTVHEVRSLGTEHPDKDQVSALPERLPMSVPA